MYFNITYRRSEVSNKASKFDGIHTKSYCVWMAGGEDCSVVVWNATLSGFKCQLEQMIGISGGFFAYQISMMVKRLDVELFVRD